MLMFSNFQTALLYNKQKSNPKFWLSSLKLFSITFAGTLYGAVFCMKTPAEDLLWH
jgi:hypothetical protein